MRNFTNKIKRNYKNRQQFLYKNGLLKYLTNSSGYVLIVVLLVISLLVTMSTEFLTTAQTNINYIRKFNERLKATMIAKAGMNLSTVILKADKLGLSASFLGKQAVSKDIDCYKDIWALNFPELPLEDGSLKISIDDENSKINLSVLANEIVDSTPYYGMTQRFFINMGLSMDHADAILDWVDIDDSRSPYGAESSDYYLNLKSPYRAKNAALDSIDELLMIKDITPEIFYGMGDRTYEMESDLVDNNKGNINIDLGFLKDITSESAIEKLKNQEQPEKFNIAREKSKRLSDYFRVNGERKDFTSDLNKININTASFRILSSLTDKMTDDTVRELISRRHTAPYKNVDEIKDLIDDETVKKNILSVKSYIFKITAIGKFNKTSVKITGIYYRDGNKFLYWSEQ
ncbi:MAG: general secretion pathway protein GspK [Spirochaetes bacterium]|nr:general secretion pathway protein GspK [Spirochaetota bacterium]